MNNVISNPNIVFKNKKERIRKLDPNIIRVGDRVQIINPEVFVRVGYPWNKQYVIDNVITKEEKEKVIELLKGVYIEEKDLCGNLIKGIKYDYLDYDKSRTYDEIIDRLAYYKLQKNHFGGNKRQVFTKTEESLKDQIVFVDSKRYVKTGTYSCGWYDEDGGEPSYLSNEKTHIILNVYKENGWLNDCFEIESVNVKKI